MNKRIQYKQQWIRPQTKSKLTKLARRSRRKLVEELAVIIDAEWERRKLVEV